jgi:hypothetical protein
MREEVLKPLMHILTGITTIGVVWLVSSVASLQVEMAVLKQRMDYDRFTAQDWDAENRNIENQFEEIERRLKLLENENN